MKKIWYWTDGVNDDSDNFPSLKDAVESATKAIANDDAGPELEVYSMEKVGENPESKPRIKIYNKPKFILRITVDDIDANGSLKRKFTDEGWQN